MRTTVNFFSCLFKILFFAYLTLSIPTYAQSTQTAGSIEVDRLGAAIYTYPILAADGVGGVKPNIAAVYNSQASNGILGKGTSISGLSTIKRCPQILVVDGQNKAITWTSEDRFCIDTQRLVIVSGTQGSPDSRYRTEIDNGVIYTAKGGAVGNPDHFEASASDGATLIFGGNSNSKEQGGATMVWALSQYQDITKNIIEFQYEGTAADGLRIKRINYAFPIPATNIGPGAYIEFEYKDREDPISRYVAGYEFRNNKLLSKVNVFGILGILYRSYQFDVLTSSGSAGFISRWQNVKECTTPTSCLDPIQFVWGTTQKNSTEKVELKDITTELLGSFPQSTIRGGMQLIYGKCDFCIRKVVDINNNGVPEFIWSERKDDYVYSIVSFDGASNPTTWIKSSRDITKTNWYASYETPFVELADINADGFLDVLSPSDTNNYDFINLNTGGTIYLRIEIQTIGYLPTIAALLKIMTSLKL